MPRFFFQIHDGADLRDAEGTVLPDVEAARAGAIKLAGALLSDHPEMVRMDEPWWMDVQDEAGAILFSLHLSTVQKGVAPSLGLGKTVR